MIDFDRLYFIDAAHWRGGLHLCPEFSADPIRIYRNEVRVQDPLPFSVSAASEGNILFDLVTCEYAALILVSPLLLSVLEPFTGWTTYPISTQSVGIEALDSYSGLAITGRCGTTDRAQGQRRWSCRPALYGCPETARLYLYFDPATWDGSDLFVSGDTGLTFATERVCRAIHEAGITNIQMSRVTER